MFYDASGIARELPGGEVEAHEDPLEALSREFREETGYEPPPQRHEKYLELGQNFFMASPDRYFTSTMLFFRFHQIGELRNDEIDPGEIAEVEWFSLEVLESLLVHPNSRKALLAL